MQSVDQLLAKDKFVAELISKGLTTEEAGKEWDKLVQIYEVGLMQTYYEMLPEEAKTLVMSGIGSPQEVANAKVVFGKLVEVMKSNKYEVDRSDLIQRSVSLAFSNYAKSKVNELTKEDANG